MSKKKTRNKGFINPKELAKQYVEDEKLSAEDLEDESEQSYDEGIDAGIESVDEFSELDNDSFLDKREDTRSKLAIIYTIATFSIFILSMLIAVLDGILRDVSIIDNLEKLIPLISGIFLGSLGFVLGYYFRKNDDK